MSQETVAVRRIFFCAEMSNDTVSILHLDTPEACAGVVGIGWGRLGDAYGNRFLWEDYYLAKARSEELTMRDLDKNSEEYRQAEARRDEFLSRSRHAAALMQAKPPVPKDPLCNIIDPSIYVLRVPMA